MNVVFGNQIRAPAFAAPSSPHVQTPGHRTCRLRRQGKKLRVKTKTMTITKKVINQTAKALFAVPPLGEVMRGQ